MAIERGEQFPIPFERVFPKGAVMVGEVQPWMEYQSREDRARGREARQRTDERTGLRIYKVTVSDPSATRDQEKSVTVQITAEVQPVPPEGVEVQPDVVVRPVEFEGMTAEPRVEGTGEFKRLGYVLRATGMHAPGPGKPARPTTGVEKPGEMKSASSGDGTAVA